MDSASIERLCRPTAFDHSSDGLTVRETHISWVILCGEYAYKLKKPVDFGFLDFSTLEHRRSRTLETKVFGTISGHFFNFAAYLAENRKCNKINEVELIEGTSGTDRIIAGLHRVEVNG